ncbi:MAG: LamG-like jellyroll fold domain-containing protein [Planctomycetota bacterium]
MKARIPTAVLTVSVLLVIAGENHACYTPPQFPPTLSSPANGDCMGTTVTLTWNPADGATSYKVYYGQNSQPTSPGTSASCCSLQVSGLSTSAKYYWRVKACNSSGCSDYSSQRYFYTTSPAQATSPNPSSPSSGISLDADLSWTAGSGAASHDVYLGTDETDVTSATTSTTGIYRGNQGPNTYDPGTLSSGTTYYWRIDEKNTCDTTKGTTWNFTTCFLPGEPNNPYPDANATGVPLDVVLSWTPGVGTPDTNGHDVYFGTGYDDVNDATDPDVLPGRGNQDANTWDSNNFDPNGLDSNSTYYWRIDEVNDCGPTKGTVWAFTTCLVPGEANDPETQGPGGEPNAIDSILSWTPGIHAEEHVVFFGIDFNDVNSATTSSSQYMGIVEVNSFDTGRRSGFLFRDGKQKGVGSLARLSEPNVIYVDRSAKGANNGTSWADAYTDLQDALTDADTSGKDIWVAEGIYKPTDGNDRTESFELISGVDVYGGFAGGELSLEQRNWRKHRCILSGDINEPGDANDNSYHVIEGADNAIIDGFTITGGNANGTGLNKRGGGILCFAVSPTIRNCTITGNRASLYGAGMYNDYPCSPTITSCFFSNNFSDRGAGMANYGGGSFACTPIISNCVFSGNEATYGGGVLSIRSLPRLSNCTFTGNQASYGAAMHNWLGSDANVTNCVLWGDTPDEIYNGGSNPTVNYCDVEGGYSPGTGNIDSDPCFFDVNSPAGADGVFGTLDDGLRIAAESNCVEAGDPNSDSNDTGTEDVTGYARFVDGDANGSKLVDMGAYEYNPSPVRYTRTWRTDAFGINESGTVVGASHDANGQAHAFIGVADEGNEPNVWVSALTDLHPAGDANDSVAYGISDSNWISGKIGDKAFVLKYPDDANMIELKSLFSETDHESVARAVTDGTDDLGAAAVGWSGGRAVLWYNLDSNEPNMHNLGPVVRYHKSKAYNVNKYRQVVGYYYPAFGDDRPDHAFVGGMQERLRDIGTLGQGNISRAFGINNGGQVVGEGTIDANDEQLRAFIYDGLQMYNLNNLITRDPNDPNWVINSASSINDDGLIAGYGTSDDSNGLTRALLLIPMRPVGHWEFDEGSGTTAMDSSLSGTHGELHGPTWTDGQIRGALGFDGVDDYVEVADGGTLGFSQRGSFSLAFRAKPSSNGSLLSKMRASNCSDGIFGYQVRWADSQFQFVAEESCVGQTIVGTGDNSAAADSWYHVTCVYDKKNMKVYLDGELEGSAAFAFDAGSTRPDKNLTIGAKSYDSAVNDHFEGLIDDVRIYPWALSGAEVEELLDGQNW